MKRGGFGLPLFYVSIMTLLLGVVTCTASRFPTTIINSASPLCRKPSSLGSLLVLLGSRTPITYWVSGALSSTTELSALPLEHTLVCSRGSSPFFYVSHVVIQKLAIEPASRSSQMSVAILLVVLLIVCERKDKTALVAALLGPLGWMLFLWAVIP